MLLCYVVAGGLCLTGLKSCAVAFFQAQLSLNLTSQNQWNFRGLYHRPFQAFPLSLSYS